MMVAVEPPADTIGAAVMTALRARCPNIRFIGCGGDAMAAAGLKSAFPVDGFAVMGLWDAAKVAFSAFARARDLAALAAAEGADAAVFVDAWSFSRICATRFKKRAPHTALFKLAAPQVWATRPKRTEFVAEMFDGVLCLLPFEPPLFDAAGARARFIGNPNFQSAWRSRGDGADFRARHGVGDGPLLAVLLGSRKGEVNRLAEVMGETVARLAAQTPDLTVVAPLAPRIEERARAAIAKWPIKPIIPQAEEKYDAFAAADAALAASGTVTTELAINATPMVVAYKVDFLTAAWVRRAVITPYASIVNIAAGRAIAPEFLQENCTAEKMTAALAPLLRDGPERAAQLRGFDAVLSALGVDGPSAEDAAASTLLDWLQIEPAA